MTTATSRPRPLADVRIVAVEQYGAGPFGSVHLAELGADVIKIEDARSGGDVGRAVPPYQSGDDSLFFETFNHDKRSVTLDLANDAGRAVFHDLVRASDAVYSNLRGDVPQKVGLRYADLAHVNPRIVCVSLSGFGMTGPRRAEPAYDYILQGMTGWQSLTGDPAGPPTKSGLSLVDYSGGLVAALALLAGVHASRRDGVGSDCDTSLFDTAMNMLTYVAAWTLAPDGAYEPERLRYSAHPSIVPFQNFRTSDGWIVIVCAKEKFWQRLIDVLGIAHVRDDARFSGFAARRANRALVTKTLQDVLATRPTSDWLPALTAAGVPCGPINDVRAALADPQTAARNLITEVPHPSFGTARWIASPVRVGEPPTQHRHAPALGEHTQTILRDLLHYDEQKIAQLRTSGAFGLPPGDAPRPQEEANVI
ncbi:MAG TPA: CoA transferase [Candidatus Elarobacter sp.]|jgi:crotonobetainyl-CoA:carnitine CoA-transferase CaiB-like acyl-CoA transferase|nr:CoA transferase [Candidatus Elarobacter sp.]